MMRTSTSRQAQGGFTLLEILVALVVLGLLMVTLTQGLRFGLQAWQFQTRAEAAHGDLDSTDRAIRTLVEQMDPGDFLGDPPYFQGTRQRVAFRTELPVSAGALPTRAADVEVLVDARHTLVLLWRTYYRVRLGPVPPPERTVLLPDVARLDLSYWQPPETPPGGKPQRGEWLDQWSARTLPALIRFRISFPAGSGRTMPDIVVAPMRQRFRS